MALYDVIKGGIYLMSNYPVRVRGHINHQHASCSAHSTPPWAWLFLEISVKLYLSFINLIKLKSFRRYEGCNTMYFKINMSLAETVCVMSPLRVQVILSTIYVVLQGLIRSGTVLVLVVSARPTSNYLLIPAEAKEHHSLFVDCQRRLHRKSSRMLLCCVFVTFLQMSSLNAHQPTDSTPTASENGASFTCCLPTKQHSETPLHNPIHYSSLSHLIWCSLTFSAIDKLLLIMYSLNKGHLIGIFHTFMTFFYAVGFQISWEELCATKCLSQIAFWSQRSNFRQPIS